MPAAPFNSSDDFAEHDWTFNWGSWDFGVEQYLVTTAGSSASGSVGLVEYPQTTIYVGPVHFNTSLPATAVVALTFSGALLAVLLLAGWLVSSLRDKNRQPTA